MNFRKSYDPGPKKCSVCRSYWAVGAYVPKPDGLHQEWRCAACIKRAANALEKLNRPPSGRPP